MDAASTCSSLTVLYQCWDSYCALASCIGVQKKMEAVESSTQTYCAGMKCRTHKMENQLLSSLCILGKGKIRLMEMNTRPRFTAASFVCFAR